MTHNEFTSIILVNMGRGWMPMRDMFIGWHTRTWKRCAKRMADIGKATGMFKVECDGYDIQHRSIRITPTEKWPIIR